MKVIGDAFFIRKGAEGARCEAHLNSQAKGLLPDRTLESFIQKRTDGATPNLWENPYRVYFKELFPNATGRIFQVKRQSKK